jgi:hypothetical protein
VAGNNWDDLSSWARGQRPPRKPPSEGETATPTPAPENVGDQSDGPASGDPKSAGPVERTGPASDERHSPGSTAQNYKREVNATSSERRDSRTLGAEFTRDGVADKTRDALADKVGIDKGVAKALTSRTGTDGQPLTTRQRAGAAANAGVVAALVALGVPPAVAQRVAPNVLKVVAGSLAFFLLLIAGLVSGGVFGSGRDPIEVNQAFEEIDESLRREILVAASRNRVPSRVLLALAGVQTSYGRYSPYDDIDRDPDRPGFALVDKKGGAGLDLAVLPSARPAIGNPKNPDEGVGMFLVRPGAAARAGVDPQNVRGTVQWLSMLMREEADRLRKSGVQEPLPNSTNYSQADDFWGKVVSTLPVVDVFNQNLGCAAPAGTSRIDAVIAALWTCELDRRTDVSIPTVTSAGGVPVVTFDSNGQATGRLVREALGVAWQWGKQRRPSAITWEEMSDISCDERAPLAGVFPIDRATAAELGIEQRCDTNQVVGAVARAVIGKLASASTITTLNPSRPWSAETVGWDTIPWSLGDAETRRLFEEQGPRVPYNPGKQCVNATYDYVATLTRSETLRKPFLQVAESTGADRTEYVRIARDTLLSAGSGNPYTDRRCAVNGLSPQAGEWLGFVGVLAADLYHVFEEGMLANAVSTPLPETVALRQIAELGGAGGGASDVNAIATPGVDAAVERLSPTPVTIDMPPAQTGLFGSSAFSLWSRVLDEALRIGGLLPDDPRSGNRATAGGGGIAIRRVDPASIPVIAKFTDGGLMEGTRCAGWGDVPIMTVEYSTRWSALCNAAQAAGVELPVMSSWRSHSEQVTIWERYGAQLAARPGTSNHQKGYALDIFIGMNDEDHIGSANPMFAFMHSIVGCLDTKAKRFSPLANPVTVEEYVVGLDAGSPLCSGELLPIKRVQTFGLVPLCTVHNGEDWADRDVILCSKQQFLKGTGTKREAWHLDFGVIFLQTSFAADCNGTVALDPTDKRSVAVAVKNIWYCEMQANGFASLSPVDGPRYPASKHFTNLAEQISSEAVVVAYCESGFNATSQSWAGYTGVFQMGEWEMDTYGGGASRVDALANIRAAAKYFVASYKVNQGLGWAGWGPWAVVNTDYWETNRAVLRPVVGRFASTHPDANGQYGPDLPNWARDPSRYWEPEGSCSVAYSGKNWSPAPELPLTR